MKTLLPWVISLYIYLSPLNSPLTSLLVVFLFYSWLFLWKKLFFFNLWWFFKKLNPCLGGVERGELDLNLSLYAIVSLPLTFYLLIDCYPIVRVSKPVYSSHVNVILLWGLVKLMYSCAMIMLCHCLCKVCLVSTLLTTSRYWMKLQWILFVFLWG